jgi:hypothetical protein
VQPNFPIASANIRQIFLLCKKIYKKFTFWRVFSFFRPFHNQKIGPNKEKSPYFLHSQLSIPD